MPLACEFSCESYTTSFTTKTALNWSDFIVVVARRRTPSQTNAASDDDSDAKRRELFCGGKYTANLFVKTSCLVRNKGHSHAAADHVFETNQKEIQNNSVFILLFPAPQLHLVVGELRASLTGAAKAQWCPCCARTPHIDGGGVW